MFNHQTAAGMKNQIAKLEEILTAIKAEDSKRPAVLPPNPHLGDAQTRGRTMIKSLQCYLAESARPEPAAAKK